MKHVTQNNFASLRESMLIFSFLTLFELVFFFWHAFCTGFTCNEKKWNELRNRSKCIGTMKITNWEMTYTRVQMCLSLTSAFGVGLVRLSGSTQKRTEISKKSRWLPEWLIISADYNSFVCIVFTWLKSFFPTQWVFFSSPRIHLNSNPLKR